MTHAEIEGHRQELSNLLQRLKKPGVKPDDSKLLDDLSDLALRVGACTAVSVRKESGAWQWDRARAPEYAYNIHQALQTASMIDACRTAAENAELTRDALEETRKGQRTSQIIAAAAVISSIAAVGSMIAASVAAARP